MANGEKYCIQSTAMWEKVSDRAWERMVLSTVGVLGGVFGGLWYVNILLLYSSLSSSAFVRLRVSMEL